MAKRVLMSVLLFCILTSGNISSSSAGEIVNQEYAIKAGFIYNFTKFIHWPNILGNGELVLCFTGDDQFGESLDHLSQKHSSSIQKITIKRQVQFNEITHCHVLFIGDMKKEYLKMILDHVRDLPILALGDTPASEQQGVGFNFFIKDNKVRFKINMEVIKRTGLKISSELLSLGELVQGQGVK